MQIANFNSNSESVKTLNPNPEIISSTVKAITEAHKEATEASEAAARSRVDLYSNEKGQEQNRQYQEYLEGSIAENFQTKVSLVEERIALKQEISDMRITLAQERADAELAIRKRQAEADLEYEDTKRKIKELKTSKVKLWAWRIVWPVVGIACAALTYLLLSI